MTHLEEPQSAAGFPTFVPGHRAVQPWSAGLDGVLRQMTPEFHHRVFIQECQEPPSALLGSCLIDSSSKTKDACGVV